MMDQSMIAEGLHEWNDGNPDDLRRIAASYSRHRQAKTWLYRQLSGEQQLPPVDDSAR